MMVEPFIVVWSLDEQRYGIALSAVDRVIHVVAVTPLPDAPEIVLGIVNVAGAVVPVVDLRRRVRLPRRELELTDHLILTHGRRRRFALLVDGVTGVERVRAEDWVDPSAILPRAERLAGVLKLRDGLTLIHDLDALLSLEEERSLEHALSGAEGPA